jgi:hypothetical protein
MQTNTIQNQMDFFTRILDKSHFESITDPAFILAGAVPDFSHRLPDDYRTCVHLGTHDRVDFVLYTPRAFHIDGSQLVITEGTLDDAKDGETEFEIKIESENIVDSTILSPTNYDGKPLHELGK